ncbi:unnamed protein product [Lactuca saligna]|uniref:F-box associated beta-propeller type 1 domain-containing protein n=1 Tax=Lactuca saligna TaxID=75948 RepID=A0AA36EBU6_LACSI|nr:unnamed protein product [Lactuca saligna]
MVICLFGIQVPEHQTGYHVLGEAEYDAIVKIYSLKTGNWKRIGDFHNGFSMDCCVQYLNGVLHWTSIQDSRSSYSWTIVSLDLAKETYGEILQPVYDEFQIQNFNEYVEAYTIVESLVSPDSQAGPGDNNQA